jgi:hypothetical protein
VTKSKDKTILLRLSPELHEAFAGHLADRKKHFPTQSEAIRMLISAFNDDPDAYVPGGHQRSNLDTQHFAQRCDILANTVSEQLKKNPEWAKRAILKADLGGSGDWAFGSRFDHFSEEKEFIAKNFVPWLIDRIVYYARRHKRVWLVADSGTTIYWPFRVLLDELKKNRRIESLAIVTNNIPGVEWFFASCRPTGDKRPEGIEPLAQRVTCKLLPGNALWEYAAVTGKETNQMLSQLRARNRSSIFIGLTTGNWVRLREKDPVYPIPLARGAGHREFKETLINVCDEIYVLTPLGKLLASQSLTQINQAFNLDPKQEDPEKKPYRDVKIDPKDARRIKLVGTTRKKPNAILIHHAEAVERRVKEFAEHVTDPTLPIESVSNMLFAFDEFSVLPAEEQEPKEFPHPYTNRIMETVFGVVV